LIAVRAVGESLNKANIGGENIEDGDYVVVDCKQQPNNGDYVLSIIDGAANFKKFFKDDSKHEIRLVSESTQEIPPIILHDSDINSSGYMVNGVVVRVIKN
jgi:repressor LexA